MDSLFKEGNVYVLVLEHDYKDHESAINDSQFVCNTDTKGVSLYGGRVNIDLCTDYYSNVHLYLKIDGLYIEVPSNSKMTTKLEPEQGVAFLNQIENLGVDSFLDNYKKNMRELRAELEKQAQEIKESLAVKEEEDSRRSLNSILSLLKELTCVIFMFSISLNAGIDNITYTDLYNNILTKFFE